MATPGDPFDTEARDNRRALQRRILAGISSRIVEEVHRALPKKGTETDPRLRAFFEDDVRDMVDGLAAAQTDLLEACSAERWSSLAAFFNERAVWYVVRGRSSSASLVQPCREQVSARASDGRRELTAEDEERLGLLTALLLFADELAGDYCDPRLAA